MRKDVTYVTASVTPQDLAKAKIEKKAIGWFCIRAVSAGRPWNKN